MSVRAPNPRVYTAQRRHALTVVELIAVVIVLAIIVAVLVPRSGRNRGYSRRLVCASNVKGLGTAMKIYAYDNENAWPIIEFDETAIGSIDYTVPAGGGEGTVLSPSRTQPSVGGPGGTRQLSVPRALWMLVRSGDVTLKSYICPVSGDSVANETDIDSYYDFAGPANVSYGFQVPYGPPLTRASEINDPRMALAADKGPFVDATVKPPTAVPQLPLNQTSAKTWRAFNSPNHDREGQNVLYGDGHATFEKSPLVGVDDDNIYTVATGNSNPADFMLGESPWKHHAPPFAPLDTNGVPQCTTDSVIFP